MILLYITIGFAIGYFASCCQRSARECFDADERERQSRMSDAVDISRQFKRACMDELIRRNGGRR
jgi:hypothetical protein